MDLDVFVIFGDFGRFFGKYSEFCLSTPKNTENWLWGKKVHFFQIVSESLKRSSWGTRNSWIYIFSPLSGSKVFWRFWPRWYSHGPRLFSLQGCWGCWGCWGCCVHGVPVVVSATGAEPATGAAYTGFQWRSWSCCCCCCCWILSPKQQLLLGFLLTLYRITFGIQDFSSPAH